MTYVEFKARIEQRLADGAAPQQRQPVANSKFQVGDIVRYTEEFQRRVNGYVDDVAGEVVGVRGRLIRVRWDDGHESAALDGSLELPKAPEPVDMAAFAEHLDRQKLIEAERALLIAEAWTTK